MRRRDLGLSSLSWVILTAGFTLFAGVLLIERAITRPDRIERRLALIRDELTRLGPQHPWAGEFSSGGGHGGYATILAPDNGHVTMDYVGGWTPQNTHRHGAVSLVDGQLLLQGIFGTVTRRLVPVRWGERRYLIEPDRLDEFANAVNLGLEPRVDRLFGVHLMRSGDLHRHAAGFPELPEPSRALLLDRRIAARILSVGAEQVKREVMAGDSEFVSRDVSVIIDAGARSGLKPGHMLYGNQGRCVGGLILRTWENRSQVICGILGGSSPRRGDVLVAGRTRAAHKASPKAQRNGRR